MQRAPICRRQQWLPKGRANRALLARVLGYSCALFIFLIASRAEAGKWDLKLSRLCQLNTTAGGAPVDCGRGLPDDPNVGVRGANAVIADDAAFRSLMSELGVIFAPNVLSPAETMGYNGFHFGIELGMVTVNPKKNADGRRFWRAAESVRDVDLASVASTERNLPPGVAPTLTLMARKGLWFPGPSFEFGFGIRHLLDSRMWSGVATVKLALHEGFQGWPVPALAIRGSASRVSALPISISRSQGSTFRCPKPSASLAR
jgi:hypothetical protein